MFCSQRKFEAIQGMHDPNFLASFASRAPYHADALLQLGMVFAHTGQASVNVVTGKESMCFDAKYVRCQIPSP